jgi:hypothetical protein
VVAYRRPCLCIAHPPGVDDVAGVTVLGLSACVKDSLPNRRWALVGGLSCHATRVNRRLGALRAPVVLRASLLADARRRAFSLLHGHLLNECLRLAVQVLASGVEGVGMARSSVATAMSFWLARGGVFVLLMSKSALIRSRACLPDARAFAARGRFSSDGGAKQSHRVVLLRNLDLEFARLG